MWIMTVVVSWCLGFVFARTHPFATAILGANPHGWWHGRLSKANRPTHVAGGTSGCRRPARTRANPPFVSTASPAGQPTWLVARTAMAYSYTRAGGTNCCKTIGKYIASCRSHGPFSGARFWSSVNSSAACVRRQASTRLGVCFQGPAACHFSQSASFIRPVCFKTGSLCCCSAGLGQPKRACRSTLAAIPWAGLFSQAQNACWWQARTCSGRKRLT